MLQITDLPHYDNSIESHEIHSYNPYSNSFKDNDEIRIPIHQQDTYVLPSGSSIYIEGYAHVIGKDPTVKKEINFINNPLLYLFQDIRYELNGVEIDRIKNAGITTTIKSFVSMNEGENKAAAVWGWNLNGTKVKESHISAVIPLNKILGFAEDYNKIVINCRHELILHRSSSVSNCVILDNGDKIEIEIQKLQWRVPHIKVADRNKLMLLKHLEKDRPIQLTFRNWDLYEYPLLPKTTKHSWSVKTASQLEKPRYVIFCLQTDRKLNNAKSSSLFDHCKVTNLKLFLNSQYFPYDSLNLKFDESKYGILYEMYANFRQSYYNAGVDPLLDLVQFKAKAPLFVIDCSRQNDSIKTGPVDVRIEIECSEQIPDNTTAYCLIINDRLFEYKPLSNIVRKLS